MTKLTHCESLFPTKTLDMASSLLQWPEPIVRVQSLSDSGMLVIPDRYVKLPSERPALGSNGDINGGFNVPIIDLAEGLVNGDTLRLISDACKEWGFFQVVNHGVSPDLMRRMKEVGRDFFHLPMEEKEIYANSPETYEGYGSRLGVEKGAVLDWNDYFFLHLLPQSIKSLEKWPSLPTTCRDTIEKYGQELLKLCGTLMKVMSLSLGLEEGFLQKAFGGDDGVGACMRLNFYPKCPQPHLTLGVSGHADPGGITVLLADDRVKGLQVRKNHQWVTVDPVPNSFIVNVGDQLQVLTNATFKSIEHRVLANSEEERLSVAFFYNPKSDIPIAPAQDFVTAEQPPLYRPMTFDEYRLYIRKKGPSGKSQVESLKARGS